MALREYATGALRPEDWATSTKSSAELGRKRPDPRSLPKKSNLGGKLIDSDKLREVIKAYEGPEE